MRFSCLLFKLFYLVCQNFVGSRNGSEDGLQEFPGILLTCFGELRDDHVSHPRCMSSFSLVVGHAHDRVTDGYGHIVVVDFTSVNNLVIRFLDNTNQSHFFSLGALLLHFYATTKQQTMYMYDSCEHLIQLIITKTVKATICAFPLFYNNVC